MFFVKLKNVGKGQDEEVRSYLIAMKLSKDVKRLLYVKIKQPEINFIPVFLSVGSTTSSMALQNEGELGDDDVFTVSTLFCINNYDDHNF